MLSPTRRDWFAHAATGLGGVALATLLAPAAEPDNPLAAKKPHFAPRARRVLTIPQWTYLKALGEPEGSRLPVAHPETGKKVYVDSDAVGISGPPPVGWKFGQDTAPTPPAPVLPVAPVVGAPPTQSGPATPNWAPRPSSASCGRSSASSLKPRSPSLVRLRWKAWGTPAASSCRFRTAGARACGPCRGA